MHGLPLGEDGAHPKQLGAVSSPAAAVRPEVAAADSVWKTHHKR